MKWKILNDLVPQQHRCCGTGLIVGSSLASAAFSTGAAVYQNESNKSWQSGQLGRQMDWQTQEAEKARQFSAQQQAQQQQNNLQLMAEQAKYNSPVYQRQQLQAAGISPAVYFGDKASFAGSSAPSAGLGSAPSASPVSGLSPTVQPMDLKVPELMQSIGSFIRDISTARKQGTETSVLEQSMEDVLRKFREEANQSEINTSLMELNKKLQSANVPVQIKQAAANLEQTYAKINLTYAEIDKTDAEEMLNQALTRFNHVLVDYKGEELRQLQLLFPLVEKNMRSQIALNYASAEERSVAAEEHAETVESIRFSNQLNRDTRESLAQSIIEAAQDAGQKTRLDKSKVNLIKELTRRFENENDWFVANQILDRIQQIAGDVLEFKNIKVKGLPSESTSSHETEVKTPQGTTVYRNSKSSKRLKGKK